MNKIKLSVIIPVYNEEKTVCELLKKVISAKFSQNMEIIIVNDGSKDNSEKEIKGFISKYKNKDIKYFSQKNGGKGSALKLGFSKATGDIFIIQDADLEYDPNDYEKLIKPIMSGKTKVVYGSRLKGKFNGYSHLSFFIGGLLVTIATDILYFAKLTDEPTCYKVFHKDLKSILINADGNKFEWEPEITAKILRKKYEIAELPINYYPRSIKEGKKINWKDGVSAIITLLKWRFKKIE